MEINTKRECKAVTTVTFRDKDIEEILIAKAGELSGVDVKANYVAIDAEGGEDGDIEVTLTVDLDQYHESKAIMEKAAQIAQSILPEEAPKVNKAGDWEHLRKMADELLFVFPSQDLTRRAAFLLQDMYILMQERDFDAENRRNSRFRYVLAFPSAPLMHGTDSKPFRLTRARVYDTLTGLQLTNEGRWVPVEALDNLHKE
jgi:hypothetical protein